MYVCPWYSLVFNPEKRGGKPAPTNCKIELGNSSGSGYILFGRLKGYGFPLSVLDQNLALGPSMSHVSTVTLRGLKTFGLVWIKVGILFCPFVSTNSKHVDQRGKKENQKKGRCK